LRKRGRKKPLIFQRVKGSHASYETSCLERKGCWRHEKRKGRKPCRAVSEERRTARRKKNYKSIFITKKRKFRPSERGNNTVRGRRTLRRRKVEMLLFGGGFA